MNILRIVAIATSVLVVSCAQVITAPPAPTSEQAVAVSPPPPPAAIERGEVAHAAPKLEAMPPPGPALGAPSLSSTITPTPLTQTGQPTTWWFVFKFNAKSFPACGPAAVTRSCPFGGTKQPYSQLQPAVCVCERCKPDVAER